MDQIKVGDRVRPRPEWRGDPNNIPSGRVIKREPFGRCGAFVIEGDHRAFTPECLEIDPENQLCPPTTTRTTPMSHSGSETSWQPDIFRPETWTSEASSTSAPTTTTMDAASSARHGYMIAGNSGTTLLDAARLATWATPQARDEKGSRTGSALYRHNSRPLNEQTAMLTPGPSSSGSPAATGKPGQLNPAFSLWLMGFPDEWLWCAPADKPRPRHRKTSASSRAPARSKPPGMRSSRKSRPRSSAPPSTLWTL